MLVPLSEPVWKGYRLGIIGSLRPCPEIGQAPPPLSLRSDRCRMGAPGTAGPAAAIRRSAGAPSAAGNRQRHHVRVAHRLSVAGAAARLAAVGHGLVVFPAMAGNRP